MRNNIYKLNSNVMQINKLYNSGDSSRVCLGDFWSAKRGQASISISSDF